MRWWGWWRSSDDGADQAAQAEAKLRRAQRATPRIEQMADKMRLDDDEFADRVARAFRRRPA